MTRLVPLAILTALLLASGAAAQTGGNDGDGCPAGLVCVSWQGEASRPHVFEIDPSCGLVVSFVVSHSTTRTVDLDGETRHAGVTVVTFARSGETYAPVAVETAPAVGNLADVEFGSVGCLAWESPDG